MSNANNNANNNAKRHLEGLMDIWCAAEEAGDEATVLDVCAQIVRHVNNDSFADDYPSEPDYGFAPNSYDEEAEQALLLQQEMDNAEYDAWYTTGRPMEDAYINLCCYISRALEGLGLSMCSPYAPWGKEEAPF